MIDSFKGQYDFLSNFFAVTILFDEEIYPSVEHAYCAAKTFDSDERWLIRSASTPGKAKKLGRNILLRPDWEKVKLSFMMNFIHQKFINQELREKLLATGDQELIEGNWWGDTFWGVCKGVGENNLGKLLMKERERINAEKS